MKIFAQIYLKFKYQNIFKYTKIWICCRIAETMLASTLVSDMKEKMDSNIPLRLKEFPKAKPEGTPEGEGVYFNGQYIISTIIRLKIT